MKFPAHLSCALQVVFLTILCCTFYTNKTNIRIKTLFSYISALPAYNIAVLNSYVVAWWLPAAYIDGVCYTAEFRIDIEIISLIYLFFLQTRSRHVLYNQFKPNVWSFISFLPLTFILYVRYSFNIDRSMVQIVNETYGKQSMDRIYWK